MKKEESKTLLSRIPLLPTAVILFFAVWLWGWLWYGDVFRIAREYSFWSPDSTLMYYLYGRPWTALLWAGQALLQLFRWPVLGALVLALLISKATWLLGYCLRLRGWWRLLQYVPAAAYLCTIAYIGFDLFFETETGLIMGIPLVSFLVLLIMAFIIRSFSHAHTFPCAVCPPKDETPLQNRIQLVVTLLVTLLPIIITQKMRPYVRVTTTMQCQLIEQDWQGAIQTAHDNADLSYRPIAAFYAIALTQTGQQGTRLFDIRLDYDEPYMHGYNGATTNAANYYMMDCDLHAGLVQTAIHHAMEHMTMNGPTLRSLHILTKCALLKNEWDVAEKYLHILRHVPFEGNFIEKYSAMVRDTTRINADPEFHNIRLTEPMHDNFENFLTQPTFLGYNATLSEGRSINALWNSLLVHAYTKTMPQFIYACRPMQGTTPPETFAEALNMMSSKYPEVMHLYTGLEYQRPRLLAFMKEVSPYMGSHEVRAEHAHELFSKWKGYYPYYYFFGNLKATRGHQKANQGTSNQGVN
ncbi:MAG: hypothetical protein IJ064_02880 [Bacteroidaceae bacterium]|nr:hypothetical protein [Bacteroidaceae bacterium]